MPPTRKPHRSFKPYCDYAFRIIWDGHAVAGISHVSALRRTTDVVEYREGGSGDTHKLPGRTQYDAITLERGVTHDAAFEDWARLVAGGTTPALGRYRGPRAQGHLPEAGVASSQLAIVIHELHFNRHDYLIWKSYGTVRPVFVLRTEGVPIVSVYKRPVPR